jgi:hypothetical protein
MWWKKSMDHERMDGLPRDRLIRHDPAGHYCEAVLIDQ